MSKENENRQDIDEQEDVKPEESTKEEGSEDEGEEKVDWKTQISRKDKKIRDLEELIAKKKKEQSKEEDVDVDLKSEVESLKMAEKKRQFGYKHSLSPEEVDKVFTITSDPSEETLEDPFVKAGLQAIRKKRKVEDNTPSSSSKSAPNFRKDFKELSKQEKDAEWQKFMKDRGVIK